MPDRQRTTEEQAHDVLAAEEFVVPAPDPGLRDAEAHDVLAAEEFGVPAVDPVLGRHGPVELPSDPTGIAEPHDVLAAEEFALPAGRGAPTSSDDRRRGVGPLLGLAALGVVALLWRKRHR